MAFTILLKSLFSTFCYNICRDSNFPKYNYAADFIQKDLADREFYRSFLHCFVPYPRLLESTLLDTFGAD